MNENIIDAISFYIIDFMLDYYTKKYIELGKKCLEDAYKYNKNNYMLFSKDFLKNDTTFEEINRKIQLIKNYLNSNYKIPSNSVFYFFTLLPPYEVKTLSKAQNLRTANNVYFDRNTPNCLILEEGKEILKKENIQRYLKQFFVGYKQDNSKKLPIKPLGNYIGIMHLIEILIRSIFFFVMNESATPKEKETLLNIFTWMSISSFQNLFNIKTRYWKVGYYFRSLLKYLFLSGSEQIQIYDKYSNNIKRNMKDYYNNTTNKLKSYLSNESIESAPIIKFPNNLPYSKILFLRKSNKNHFWIGCPFFLTAGKDIDKNDKNKLKVYIAIVTYNGFDGNNFLIKNVILSYSNL